MPGGAEIQFLTQDLARGNAGNAQPPKALHRILQDPINIASRVASFVLELVQDQPPKTRSGVPMLSLYTNLVIRLRSDEKGATAVEYGIMVGLIAVVIIVAVSLLGTTLQDMFVHVQCTISGHAYTAGATSGAVGTCAP